MTYKSEAAQQTARLLNALNAPNDLTCELAQAQIPDFVDAERTPIEDASVNWPSPYTTVARLTLPKQDTDSTQGQALAKQVEGAIFDPWQALAAHKPLGDVMRARKAVYFVSQQARGAV